MNKVIIDGRLVKDPEVRTTQTGKKVASFTIANDDRIDANKNKVAQFFDITAWDKGAEFIANYFTKGRKILIEGELQQRKYETQDGQKRTVIEINLQHGYFMDSKPNGESKKSGDIGTVAVTTSDFVEVNDEDLPF